MESSNVPENNVGKTEEKSVVKENLTSDEEISDVGDIISKTEGGTNARIWALKNLKDGKYNAFGLTFEKKTNAQNEPSFIIDGYPYDLDTFETKIRVSEAQKNFKERYNPDKEPREITNSTYERAQKRMEKHAGGVVTGRNVQSGPDITNKESGRFNMNSDTPLLTPGEDAGDFQLFSETQEEASAREDKAERDEAERIERAKKEAEKAAPDLDFSSPEEQKQDADTIIRNTAPGSAERVNAFMGLPDGEHTVDGKKFTKHGLEFERDGQKLSARGIERSFKDVQKNTENIYIRMPIDRVRQDAENGVKLAQDALKILEKQTATENENQKSAKIEDYGEKIEGSRKDLAVKTGKRGNRNTAELEGDNIPAWRKKYFAMDDHEGKWDLYVEDKSRIGNCLQVTRQQFSSEEEALKHIPEAYIEHHYRFYETDNGKRWSLYRLNKSSRKLTDLKSGFNSKEDAMKWALEHVDDLSGMRNSKGESDLLTKPDYERTGERRMHRDVTPEDLAKTFGFRGIQFGLWEKQDERQQILNDAYEALYDLADLLKIPPRAISLNGELGAAFGARGHGGKARAHYEPGEVVINLTKPKGAGTFAHEWFHALDNYFKKQSMGYEGQKGHGNYLSEETANTKYEPKEIHHSNGQTVYYDSPKPGPGGMREELFKKFKELKKAIKDSERPKSAEEIQNTSELIEKKRNRVRQYLSELREKLANAAEKIPSRRKLKNATEEQLKAFDDVAKKIMADNAPSVKWQGVDSTRSKYGVYRYTSELFEKLNDIYKSVTGYSGYNSKYSDSGDVGRIAYAMAGADQLKATMNDIVKEGTRFYQDARKLDEDRSGGYWSKDIEMFARAFSAFIEDKLKSEGRKSEYLSYGSDNKLYDWGIVSPFPGGEERTRINKAFQAFFDGVKHKEDDKGNVRLYSLKRENNGFKTNSNERESIDNILQNHVNANEETGKIQNLSSASTSLNQVAAGLKMIDFASDTTNLDIGGGKYDAGTQYLAEKGVKNIVFDPFNRDADENRNAFDRMKDGGVDTVTCNNVLNVIAEKEQRSNVILQAAKAIKPDGTAYFTVYEGNGSGIGKQSQNDAWQNNRKTADYVDEIKQHFGDVVRHGKLIVAQNPIVKEKLSTWSMDGSSENSMQYSLKRHKQVNPIVEDGKVKQEYADLLNDKEYTPEHISEWDAKAIEWITRQGGVRGAAEQIASGTAPMERHVATIVRRHLLNSDIAESLPPELRQIIAYKNIDFGTDWGREGAARRLAALTLKSIDNARAVFRKLHENMPDEDLKKLRNDILDREGVDILNLPPDIIKDKKKLDAVLRAELSAKSKWYDKGYEYWVNAILSAPATHAANVFGNTANAVYELGAKRFAEAAINSIAKRKDGASFGEFKHMWKAFDFKNAWNKAVEAFDLETLTPDNKFRDSASVAIPGKTGRAIRTPGRLLVAADAFSRELLIPVEAASRAYREAKAQGMKGVEMQNYVEKQMANPASKAYRDGLASVEKIIFQEDPGAVVQKLISMKNSDGPGALVLKYMLPFMKTPANILRQTIRKSPLGIFNPVLVGETVQALRGKRSIDSEYLGHAAEQILAWGAFLALGGFDDDDDETHPFITGSSAAYGSAEQKFKANEIPPYSIRIGDTYYSYKRIEPLAGGLSLIADARQAIRDAKNGKTVTNALLDVIRKQGKMISEKSYLDSINQICRFMEDPERSAANFGTNFVSSWVPNAVKQTLNAMDGNVGDYKSREKDDEFLKDQFHVITSRSGFTSRVPKVDLFGHEITKEEAEETGGAGDFLWRLMVPVNRRVIDESHPGKRLIENYNITHPETQWWGGIPNYQFTVNKKKYYFGNEDYHDFAMKSGRLAEEKILEGIRRGFLSVENPTEKDIELIKKIFTRARKVVRDEMYRKHRYSE